MTKRKISFKKRQEALTKRLKQIDLGRILETQNSLLISEREVLLKRGILRYK